MRPEAHDMHVLEPAEDENLPAGHDAQTYALLTYCPASQLVSSNTTLAATQENENDDKMLIKSEETSRQNADEQKMHIQA
jgi:hypothetical protein